MRIKNDILRRVLFILAMPLLLLMIMSSAIIDTFRFTFYEFQKFSRWMWYSQSNEEENNEE
jgi:hypothetical protein